MSFLFENFRKIYSSYKKLDNDPEIIDEVSFVEDRIIKRDNLNFFKFDKMSLDEKVMGILLERGEDVSPERLNIIIKHINDNHKNNEVKRRFLIQVIISTILLSFSIWYLQSGKTTAELEKLTVGFIGTIVGYWLR